MRDFWVFRPLFFDNRKNINKVKKQLTLYFNSDKIYSVAAEKAETKIKESRRTGDCENFQKESEKVLDKNEYPLYNG